MIESLKGHAVLTMKPILMKKLCDMIIPVTSLMIPFCADPTGFKFCAQYDSKNYNATAALGNGLVVSTPTVVACSIPTYSTCLFHVVPRVLGDAADEKTGPIVPYGRIKPVLIVSSYLVGPSAIIG